MRIKRRTLMAGLGVALGASACQSQFTPTPPGRNRLCDPPPPPPTDVIYDMGPPTLGDRIDEHTVRVSGDGTELAARHRGQVLIWDTSDGSLTQAIGEQEPPLGYNVLDATADFTMFVVNADGPGLLDRKGTFLPLRTELDLTQHSLTHAAFSPSGDRAALLTSTGNVELLSVSGRESIRILPACTEGAQIVRFSPNGRNIAVGSFQEPAQVWDIPSGKLVATLGGREHGSGHLDWSDDGTLLAVGATAWNTDGEWHVAVYDTTQWKKVHQEARLSAGEVGFVPDGSLLVLANGSNRLGTWDLDDGIQEYPVGHTARGLVVGPDERAYVTDRSTITALDPRTGEKLVTFEAPPWDCSQVRPGHYTECP